MMFCTALRWTSYLTSKKYDGLSCHLKISVIPCHLFWPNIVLKYFRSKLSLVLSSRFYPLYPWHFAPLDFNVYLQIYWKCVIKSSSLYDAYFWNSHWLERAHCSRTAGAGLEPGQGWKLWWPNSRCCNYSVEPLHYNVLHFPHSHGFVIVKKTLQQHVNAGLGDSAI